MMDSKTLIAFVLMFLIYTFFLMPKPDPNNSKKVETSVVESGQSKKVAAKSSENSQTDKEASEQAPKLYEETYRLENELFAIQLNGLGEIHQVEWKRYLKSPRGKTVVEEKFDPEQFNRLRLITTGGDPKWALKKSDSSQLSLESDLAGKAVFTRQIFVEPDSYILKITDEVLNKGSQTLSANWEGRLFQPSLATHESPSFWKSIFNPQAAEIHEVIVFQDGKPQRETIDKSKKAIVEKAGIFGAAGFGRKYFFLGFVPTDFSIESTKLTQNEDHSFRLLLNSGPKSVAPGETSTFKYSLYLGPKEIPQLEKASPELGKAVDYGSWIGPIARLLLGLLHFFYSLIPNYGVAIILLTGLVKLCLYPLAYKSAISMRKLQLVQPKMTELREKFKGDKARLQAEMMNLYRSEKVNPVGGCLPLLLQMPVFFALYRVFYASIELRHAPFFGWIQDLSSADPYFVTPVLMTALMWLQNKLTPQPPVTEENEAVQMQRSMLKWMPIIFGSMMLFLPAGLTLYFLVSALISILQQLYLNKHLNLKFPLLQKTA